MTRPDPAARVLAAALRLLPAARQDWGRASPPYGIPRGQPSTPAPPTVPEW
ncbi:MAG TPA: hypothetical protein VH333_05040 [Pseudonocardiaceae bacterium]|nr:hypothetical protein [Pseudonocardiaceae bacterium]